LVFSSTEITSNFQTLSPAHALIQYYERGRIAAVQLERRMPIAFIARATKDDGDDSAEDYSSGM